MLRKAIERVINDTLVRQSLIKAGYQRARQLTIENFSSRVFEIMAWQLDKD